MRKHSIIVKSGAALCHVFFSGGCRELFSYALVDFVEFFFLSVASLLKQFSVLLDLMFDFLEQIFKFFIVRNEFTRLHFL